MAGRRWRRVSRPQNLLPLQHAGTHLSPALACWYCDFKTVAFNSFVYSLGRKHARPLRVWYAIGVVFSLVTLIGVTLTLLWEVNHSIPLGGFYMMRSNLSVNWFFGINQYSGARLSLADAAIMVYSTLVAVTVHEFGHALAAASQGIQVEYVAIFWALIFPGAFVAFNYDVLHNSSFLSALRVYCAGIWHNAVFCAICALTLLFLPTILHPFYMHGKSPVVVDVAPASPLSGYLSRGDIITSLDGAVIHSPHEWREMFVKMGNYLDSEANGIKGYCVSNSWLDKSNKSQSQDYLSCPDELATFVKSSCSISSPLKEGPLTSASNTTEWKHCLSASDVVKLQKCGDGWKRGAAEGVCACLEDESCMAPVQSPGLAWVEISFKKPHLSECLNSRSDGLSLNLSFSLSESSCGGTFVFVSNADSLLDTVLSAYNPRWMTGGMVLYFPILLERVLSCMLHISASLALFNCLPAFFLDGESIMETCILSITWLRPRLRRRFTKLVLCGGSILTIYVFLQVLFVVFRKSS